MAKTRILFKAAKHLIERFRGRKSGSGSGSGSGATRRAPAGPASQAHHTPQQSRGPLR